MSLRSIITEFAARSGRIIRIILNTGMSVYVAGMLLYLLLRLVAGDQLWWLGMINAFVLFTFLPLLIVVPLSLLLRKRGLILVSMALAAVAVIWVGRYYLPRAQAASSGRVLHIITFNVWADNPRLRDVEAWLRGQNADIVLMQENPPLYNQSGLTNLRDLYPYQFVQNRMWGNLILSRFPFKTPENINMEVDATGAQQRVTLDIQGQTIAIYNIHFLIPVRPKPRFWLSQEQSPFITEMLSYDDAPRNFEIKSLLERLNKEPLPYLVAGDFNTSDQSVIYNDLAAHMGDTFREVGSGIGTSWPISESIGLPAYLPPLVRLDYVWHSPAFRALEAHQGPKLGSDHLPLAVTVELS